MFLGFLCEIVGSIIGVKTKLSRFTVKMLTMHRWFNIESTNKDLGYAPVIGFKEGWPETVSWFKTNWLPTFKANRTGLAVGVAAQTQAKIDIQTGTDGNGAKKER